MLELVGGRSRVDAGDYRNRPIGSGALAYERAERTPVAQTARAFLHFEQMCATAAAIQMATLARHPAGERRRQRRRPAFEVAARAANAVGINGGARVTERQVLAMHWWQVRLIVDAGISHENA